MFARTFWVALIAATFIVTPALAQPVGKFTAPRADYLTTSDVATVRSQRWYVETTGNDSNDCKSLAKPCLTVQGALKKLPKRVRHPQRITVGVGTFAGALVEGFSIETELGNTDSTYPAWLTIEGTLSSYTPATGLQTGTVASFTAESATAFGTATVTGAGWTVNDLAGRIFHTTGGTGSGQYLMVASNTATVATFAGTVSTMDATTTFEIVTPGTVINATPTGFTGIAGLNFNGGALNVPTTTNSGVTTVGILTRYLRFTTTTYGILWRTPYIRATFESIRCETVICFSAFNYNSGINVTLNRSALSSSAASFSYGTVSLSGNYLKAGSGNNAVRMTDGLMVLSRNYIVQTNSAAIWVDHGGQIDSTRDRIAGDGTANSCVQVGAPLVLNSNRGETGARFMSTNGDWSGCAGSALVADGPVTAFINATTGTSNTGYGLLLRYGATVEISSTTTVTGSLGDISVDGSAITYVALRAASPKSYFGMSYGSLIYER